MGEPPDELIRTELAAGEELLWAGRPPQGLRLQPGDWFLIPFSLMWGGFAIFWEVMAVVGQAPWFASLWGIPFVLIGLYLIAGRFWHDAAHRRRTAYGVTPERVVIISGLFSRRIKSIDLDTLSDVTLTERRGGAGTVSFGPSSTLPGWYGGVGWPWTGSHFVPAFELPSDAREVYEMVRAARRAAKGRG